MKLFSVALVKGWKIETRLVWTNTNILQFQLGREDEKEKRETVIDY